MVKVKTVGMIPIAKGFPDIKAHEEIPLGYIFAMSGKQTAAPTDATKKGDMLYVALNTHVGDDEYTNRAIRAGDYVNGYLLKAWEGQSLIFDDGHVAYKANQDYSTLNIGALLGVTTDGRLEVISSAGDYALYFEVVDKYSFNGNGIEARIVLNTVHPAAQG